MILYATLGTNDLARALRFYDAVLAPLGVVRRVTKPDEAGYGTQEDGRCRIWIVRPFDKHPASRGNGSMLALEAPDRATVDAVHAAGLAHAGSDDGPPGVRSYHPHFYACYLRDPDGNKISAVCETPPA